MIQKVAVWALPVLAAIILHEISHGWVANQLGDPTAARAGRLTLNPLPHIDPVGTVLLPLLLIITHAPFLFGWAKPVPVNFGALRRPKRDMVLVAAAGPLTNGILAIFSAVAFRWLVQMGYSWDSPSLHLLANSVGINVMLAVFNLVPILPLDGGRVLTGLLPLPQAIAFSRTERYGMLIVMVLLATNALGRIVGPVVNGLVHVLLLNAV